MNHDQSLHYTNLSIDGLFVGSLIKQGIELSSISDLNLSDPALTLGALVDGLSLILKDAVTLDNLASNGGEDIGGRLDGLDSADGLAGDDLEVGLGKLYVNDITQGVGGVFGDTDLGYRGCVSYIAAPHPVYYGSSYTMGTSVQ